MHRLLVLLAISSLALFGQYSVEPAGPPPSDLPAGMVAALSENGHKVVAQDGTPWAEFWFAKDSVEGDDTGELDVSWGNVAHGTFIGVVRWPSQGESRRGQVIEPGVYTLRFSFYPVDGAHQGVEPSRDFLILSKAEDDTDPNAKPDYETLMPQSMMAAGTPHPLTMACWKAEGDWQEGISQMDHDTVLGVKVGDTEINVIVKGINTH
jgi:hypothetical protein